MKNINHKNKPLLIITLGSLLLIGMTGCKKFLDVGNPPDKVVADAVFNSDVSSVAVITDFYPGLYAFSSGRNTYFDCGLAADEFELHYQNDFSIAAFYKNDNVGNEFWNNSYPVIHKLNAAIEGIEGSTGLSEPVKKQLAGEAKFLRAFRYFYLVNLYGDVPLLLTSDYKTNSTEPRTPKDKVYEQIIKDLLEAKDLLNTNYIDADVVSPTTERIRPNRSAAIALLARVYLYTSNWTAARAMADSVINNNAMYDTVPLDQVFLKNNKEAIFQLQPRFGESGSNTDDGRLYIMTNGPGRQHPVSVSAQLLASFEVGDNRKTKWLGIDSTQGTHFYFPFKYKIYKPEDPSIEYQTIIRLAEMYLIRAEAKGRLGDFDGASNDFNVIRRRAGLGDITVTSEDELLEALLRERFVELFTEGAHRWFDLKRTGKVNEVMEEVTPLKGGAWIAYKQLFPLPITDLKLNTNLVQNPGYPQ